ncbi:MAG: hypothetical protein ACRDI2_15670 [Chloroflexota bacterium]
MEEDVLGPRQTIIGTRYDTCVRCGQSVPRTRAATLRTSGDGPTVLPNAPETIPPRAATQDGPPLILCPTCAQEVAAGEPLETESQDDSL